MTTLVLAVLAAAIVVAMVLLAPDPFVGSDRLWPRVLAVVALLVAASAVGYYVTSDGSGPDAPTCVAHPRSVYECP